MVIGNFKLCFMYFFFIHFIDNIPINIGNIYYSALQGYNGAYLYLANYYENKQNAIETTLYYYYEVSKEAKTLFETVGEQPHNELDLITEDTAKDIDKGQRGENDEYIEYHKFRASNV